MKKYKYNYLNRPAIDPILYWSQARERVLERLEPFGCADLDDAPPDAAKTYKIGLSIFEDMEERETAVTYVHELMRKHWEVDETNEAWDSSTLQSLGKAMTDLWQGRRAQELTERAEQEAKQLKRKREAARIRAEEEVEKNAREQKAALARQISEEFGVTLRQARTLRDEGTCHYERAQRLAEISGKDASTFLRKDHRKRNGDLVRLFMTLDHQHVTFTHFVHDADKVISDEALRVFLDENKNKFRPGEDFKSLERMIERLREFGCPLTLESATTLWREYTVWRINTISGMARYDVEFE
jgi:hypothetical protein